MKFVFRVNSPLADGADQYGLAEDGGVSDIGVSLQSGNAEAGVAAARHPLSVAVRQPDGRLREAADTPAGHSKVAAGKSHFGNCVHFLKQNNL
jgi:hypothetical protein